MAPAYTSLPDALAYLLAFVVANAVAICATLIARRFTNNVPPESAALASSWSRAVGAVLALLIAFMIVSLWTAMHQAQLNVDAEAAAVRSVDHDLQPSQRPLVVAYLRASIDEWPSLCAGIPETSKARAALGALEREGRGRNASADDDLYRQFTALETLRYDRVRAAEAPVPRQLWFAIVVLALCSIVVLSLIPLQPLGYHVALMMLAATSLATLFWVATLMDYPFCGSISVQPAPLVSTLGALHEER